MHRIDTEGATPQGTFQGGDPQAGLIATRFSPEWCTAVQEEAASVIEAAGLVLDKNNNGQLLLAIQRLTGGAPAFRNRLINGDFRIFQRGQGLALYADLPNSTDTYTFDRWAVNPGTKNVVVVARDPFVLGQTEVAGNPQSYMRIASSSGVAGGPVVIKQRIEGVESLSGQVVSISCYMARLGGSPTITAIQARLVQHFGTGGSPSSDVSTDFTDDWDVAQVAGSFLRYTSTLTLPSVAGKTLGSAGDDYLELQIDIGSPSATFSLALADVQLEDGGAASAYQRLPLEVELARCRRFYEKSYEFDVDPGTNTTAGAAVCEENNGALRVPGLNRRFATPKRSTPTVTWYNPDGTVSEVENEGVDRVVSASTQVSSEHTGYPTISSALTNGLVLAHWTAEAEL